MDDAVHINVEIVTFQARWVGKGAVEGKTDAPRVVGEVDTSFKDVLDNLGVLFGKPAVKGWDSHGRLRFCVSCNSMTGPSAVSLLLQV